MLIYLYQPGSQQDQVDEAGSLAAKYHIQCFVWNSGKSSEPAPLQYLQ